jgi:hypothetical protein
MITRSGNFNKPLGEVLRPRDARAEPRIVVEPIRVVERSSETPRQSGVDLTSASDYSSVTLSVFAFELPL